MSNAEFCAYQEMLRGCEESLFSQQVGDDDEIIEREGDLGGKPVQLANGSDFPGDVMKR